MTPRFDPVAFQSVVAPCLDGLRSVACAVLEDLSHIGHSEDDPPPSLSAHATIGHPEGRDGVLLPAFHPEEDQTFANAYSAHEALRIQDGRARIMTQMRRLQTCLARVPLLEATGPWILADCRCPGTQAPWLTLHIDGAEAVTDAVSAQDAAATLARGLERLGNISATGPVQRFIVGKKTPILADRPGSAVLKAAAFKETHWTQLKEGFVPSVRMWMTKDEISKDLEAVMAEIGEQD